MTKVSFKQYSNFVDATDAELDEGFGEFVSKVFGSKPDEEKLAKLKADRQKLLTKKTAAQIAKDKAKDELWKAAAQRVADSGKKTLDKKAGPTTGRSLAAQGRAAELDWVRNMESAVNFASEYQLNEGVMSQIHQELSDLVPKIENGDVDMSELLAGRVKGISAKTQTFLQHRYDTLAGERHLHADDDFEKIEAILADELSKEFATEEE